MSIAAHQSSPSAQALLQAETMSDLASAANPSPSALWRTDRRLTGECNA